LSARYSLRPLFSRDSFLANLGRDPRRENADVFLVIASEAKQSISPQRKNGLLRFARNDGLRLFEILNLKRIGGRLACKIAGGGFYA
jgi:hypothetical protein